MAVFFFSSFIMLSAQSTIQCGDQWNKILLEKKYPGVTDIIESTFKNAKNSHAERGEILRIPVVFHVLYNNEEQNISDEVLKSQIDVLNKDFRRLNSNASETRSIFQDIASDPEIEFFFAGEDPEGNPSKGITRTFTEKQSFINISIDQFLEAFAECGFDIQDPAVAACIEEFFSDFEGIDLDAMKSSSTGGKDAWDTKSYLNIWVANMAIETAGMEVPFILGFAYPPMEAPNWPDGTLPEDLISKDGVVLHYQVVGKNNPNAGPLIGINDEGRTAVHEIGHYLGLRHIWGDGDCTMDDGIIDTPTMASNSQATVDVNNCTEMHNKDTCVDDMFPDMIENYMDYSIERCQNMFTVEQILLMRSMLEGPRSGLLANTISSTENISNQEPFPFPNPSSGQINILSWKAGMISKVYDQSGSLIYHSDQSSFFIDVIPGLYFIEISGPKLRLFKKLVIE